MDSSQSARIRQERVPEVGLTTVFEPERASVDIVFVHGFTGCPYKTWTHPRGTPPRQVDEVIEPPSKVRKLQSSFRSRAPEAAPTAPIFWPRDLLPITIPDARVLTYGYDTHLRHKLIGEVVSQLTAYDIAKDLLVSLEANRRDEPSRPIVFICHSLGGIVVKEMLRQGCHHFAPDKRAAFESTIGIIFFGTPHNGADPRDFVHHVVEQFARLFGLKVPEHVAKALLPDSEHLRRLRDEFNPIAHKQQWCIYSFQESKGVRFLKGKKVVGDSSSSLGLSPLETTQHINNDHRDMCRFTDHDDPEYVKVADALRKILNGLAVRSAGPLPGQDAQDAQETGGPLDDTKRAALLRSLRFHQIDSRLESVKAAHAKTCTWFLDASEYLDWLDSRKLDSHHGFLWVKGKPGAGKSTLMKLVLTRYRKKFGNCVSFFFHARGAELEKTTMGMYRSLLFQLLTSRRQLQHAFDAAGIASWNATEDHVWGIETLKVVFREAVCLLGHSKPVTCFIDALDECPDTEVRDMVEFLEDLGNHAASEQIPFRVLFSSRHYPHITISNGLNMVLEAQDHHSDDIRTYVESRLKISAKHTDFRDEIITRIQAKASGVFMWVVLVVEILNKSHDGGDPASKIRKKLEGLPGNLSELFRDILMRNTENTENKDELRSCLQWILFARRPLRPNELYCAINLSTEQQVASWEQDDDIQAEKFIVNCSKGLAEVVKSGAKARSKRKVDAETEAEASTQTTHTVQFIHESVRDFLLKDGGLRILWADLGDNFEAQSHEKLKKWCLTYINIWKAPRIDGHLIPVASTTDTSGFPLLEYATQSVLFHSNAAAARGVDQGPFLRYFPRGNWLLLHNTFEPQKARHYQSCTSVLYVLAEHDFAALIPTQMSAFTESGVDVEVERFGTPLFAALATKSKYAAQAILKTIAQDHPSVPKLHDMCEKLGQRELPQGWNRSFRYKKTSGVLGNAVEAGDAILAVFLIFLYPALPSSSVEIGEAWRTILRTAAHKDSEAPAMALLSTIQEGRDNCGDTPLHHAIGYSRCQTYKDVLDAAANLEARDCVGQTPLHHCCSVYHFEFFDKEILELLLDASADIEARDQEEQTPLSKAARYGSSNALTVLLKRGARLESRDADGRTPLSWAATREMDSITELIKYGAQIEAKDNEGRTPLSWAAVGGHGNTVDFLVQEGAQIGTKDNDGRTPLDWAVTYGREDVARCLQGVGARNGHGYH